MDLQTRPYNVSSFRLDALLIPTINAIDEIRGLRTMFWPRTLKFFRFHHTPQTKHKLGEWKGAQPLGLLGLIRFIDHSDDLR